MKKPFGSLLAGLKLQLKIFLNGNTLHGWTMTLLEYMGVFLEDMGYFLGINGQGEALEASKTTQAMLIAPGYSLNYPKNPPAEDTIHFDCRTYRKSSDQPGNFLMQASFHRATGAM